MTTERKARQVEVVECETCNGLGWIDERLGGYSFSNPKAPCPDCDGDGEIEVPAQQPEAQAGGAVAPIERDERMSRTYIPLPGGWEVQTKGKGSTFRICDPQGEHLPIPNTPYLHETLERMAREVHAACTTPPGKVPEGMIERIKAAEQRILDGHAPRRIPADPTDVDLVLAEVRLFLEGKPAPFWLAAAPAPKE